MIRILAFALALTACSCSLTPIAPNAQRQIEAIRSAYETAHAVRVEYDALPPCPALVRCADEVLADAALRADYQAAGALVKADSERTASTIADARAAAQTFLAAAMELEQ